MKKTELQFNIFLIGLKFLFILSAAYATLALISDKLPLVAIGYFFIVIAFTYLISAVYFKRAIGKLQLAKKDFEVQAFINFFAFLTIGLFFLYKLVVWVPLYVPIISALLTVIVPGTLLLFKRKYYQM